MSIWSKKDYESREGREIRKMIDENFDVSMLQDTFEKFGTTAEEFSRALSGLSQRIGIRKKITEITIENNWPTYDVTSVGDPSPKTMRGPLEVIVRDQDGELVDPELKDRIMNVTGSRSPVERVDELLWEWNNSDPEPVSDPEDLPDVLTHDHSCLYIRGSDLRMCSCQPPTMLGKQGRWDCQCCHLPLALEQHGLCDVCEGHQYSDPRQAEREHEVILSEL